MHRAPLTALLAALLASLAPPWDPATLCAQSPRRPNVLLILADDLGCGDLGCYQESSRIPTPRLDALAAQGLRFTDAHSPSAVCTPTRYALLTGRYAWRSRLKSGVLDGNSRLLIEPGRPTIASRLRDVGYATAAFGKWHLGLGAFDPEQPKAHTDYGAPLDGGPHTTGFDESLVIPASLDMPPYVWVRNGELEEAATARTPGSRRRWDGGDGFWRAGPMAPTFDFTDVQPRVVRAAVDWLQTRRSDATARPFFCYVALPAPHTPWLPTDEFRGRSGAGYYGDYVAEVDAGIGAILDALDASGRADDTLVVVTSDNGSHWRPEDIETYHHAANMHWRGMKADGWEAGHRVPLLVRWPGHVSGDARSDALIGLVDLFATITDAARAPLGSDEAEDSISQLDVLTGAADAERSELVCHSMRGLFVLRDGPFKLIDGLGSGGFTAPAHIDPVDGGPLGQLYDLDRDPGETENRWLAEPERVARMRARLDAIRAGTRTAPLR
ncbi:MAG: arylsulfatase [Planctomycetes bacterium]|nr:arylsulfatase [Planctomycetota bacterium]